ncbi:pyruvate dehydrogenase E2 component (dihydrolipoamide acetyltransferase) [Pseudomonas delhiensis]|uniref:Acetyltransferase component of pyruvate dehydrogenase complex n=1 Tax=Pseudomonas delhiensis TaxID=366289 RepID=A0A239K9S8_9PSED|nr:dihydrolipoyllysine-residue acetyltransferase [Pseudomonas delhiensis]SDJ32984.1 pyruvate dehydrogenase E2 component (dihydrolipoamide acetyltransferase) [Pseudomonas delhiensis]SNT14855.1 pyruvate dehydrogenase E2 component (dihydrolipoamide acetyltransferase) [Pseudomonas delhiensis]
MQQLMVPDIGDFKDLPVVEVLIKAGDVVAVEQPLIVLESDKAVMDVPSTLSCTIREVLIKPGDKVSQGSVIAHIEAAGEGAAAPAAAEPAPVVAKAEPLAAAPAPVAQPVPAASAPAPSVEEVRKPQLALAGPAVRKLARELAVDLDQVPASGPNGRVLREDVLAFVKAQREQPAASGKAGGGLDLLPWPQVDFAQFGHVERRALSRIKRISAANLHRNWVSIPHVTNHSQADVTELEALRVQLNAEAREGQAKVTLLAFLIKACVAALQRFPQFNVSLEGDEVVQKHYFHIGFAADTPNGLVVPVIRDADRKGIAALAAEMAELSQLARAGKLAPAQMQGGCFSISSLGGIGGGHFTPIINAPEVAILGVGRAELQPRWDGNAFQPRLQLPLSLSWDHRAVDGAEAGRFLAHLATLLGDFRRVLV